jgi:hypothetical protein
MYSRLLRLQMPIAGSIAIALALLPATALAHEVRPVGGYVLTVGWQHEPAYTSQQNAVQLLLADSRGKAVTDLGDSLKVQVVYQGLNMPVSTLDPSYDPDTGLGKPGEYLAAIIPTRPGDYTFRFTGTVHGQTVDQSFSSGADTFDAVKDPAAVEFPVKDPTQAQVAQRLERLDSRLASDNASLRNQIGTLYALAIAGVVLAALACLGILLLVLRRGVRFGGR